VIGEDRRKEGPTEADVLNVGPLEAGNFGAGERTKGVETLLGNPKSAILKLSAPMIVSMLLFSPYNVVDAFLGCGCVASLTLEMQF